MRVTDSTYMLIKDVEGEKLTAYQCPAKVWTISCGITFYHDGSKVKQGDKISAAKSIQLFKECSKQREDSVNNIVTVVLNQHQWDVVFSICWQYGAAWLKKSLFLKQVNKDPNNIKEIRRIFDLMEYDNRRNHEFAHYIK